MSLFWDVRNNHKCLLELLSYHLKKITTIFPVVQVYSKLIKKSVKIFVNCIFKKFVKWDFIFPSNVTMMLSYDRIGSQEQMV